MHPRLTPCLFPCSHSSSEASNLEFRVFVFCDALLCSLPRKHMHIVEQCIEVYFTGIRSVRS
jgi:hypothetical protein